MKGQRSSLWVPTFYAPKLTEVTADFFIKQGTTTLCCDLDNTLAPFDELKPRKVILDWIKKMKSAGLDFLIISNNDEERVKPFAKAVGVDYLVKTGKSVQN